ncbi:unnamed protein product [Arctia plantaginis]|uniref:Uncharacterized protein n=1 Tax=Arctia plantaginis TaxID=874455 RepID=A0A8S1A6U7_ARCPL|nr:unnamed protein product [Arctia plantaginis]
MPAEAIEFGEWLSRVAVPAVRGRTLSESRARALTLRRTMDFLEICFVVEANVRMGHLMVPKWLQSLLDIGSFSGVAWITGAPGERHCATPAKSQLLPYENRKEF